MKRRIASLAASCVVLLHAQQPEPVRFEVASIKPNKSAEHNTNWNFDANGHFSGTNVPVRFLITMAYMLKDTQLSGLPGWADSEKYDLQTKAEGPIHEDQIYVMLRSLLADRFGLQSHWVMKNQSVYALSITRGGAKLQLSKKGSCVVAGPDNPPVQPGDKPPDYCGTYFWRGGEINGFRITISQLLVALGNQLDYPVIDRTGLKGAYDIHFSFNPDEVTNDGPDNSAGASIFTSLQEQLGLKLQSTKGPVSVLVIDHIERPSEN